MPRRAAAAAAAAAIAPGKFAGARGVKKRKTDELGMPVKSEVGSPHLQVVTAQGKRDYQEDAFGYVSTSSAHVFGVFDGHGGEQCSQYCSIKIPPAVAAHKHLGKTPRRALTEVFCDIDSKFCREFDQSGSTATVGVLQATGSGKYKLTVANVGDSSAVLLRNGKSKMVKLSGLHHGSCPVERDRIVKQGGLILFDYMDKIWRVQGVLSVTRAIGDASLKPYVIASPEIKEVFVVPGDLILIASDGLWDEVNQDKVVEYLRGGPGLQALVDSIADVGEDNITAMVVDVAKAIELLTCPGKIAENASATAAATEAPTKKTVSPRSLAAKSS